MIIRTGSPRELIPPPSTSAPLAECFAYAIRPHVRLVLGEHSVSTGDASGTEPAWGDALELPLPPEEPSSPATHPDADSNGDTGAKQNAQGTPDLTAEVWDVMWAGVVEFFLGSATFALPRSARAEPLAATATLWDLRGERQLTAPPVIRDFHFAHAPVRPRRPPVRVRLGSRFGTAPAGGRLLGGDGGGGLRAGAGPAGDAGALEAEGLAAGIRVFAAFTFGGDRAETLLACASSPRSAPPARSPCLSAARSDGLRRARGLGRRAGAARPRGGRRDGSLPSCALTGGATKDVWVEVRSPSGRHHPTGRIRVVVRLPGEGGRVEHSAVAPAGTARLRLTLLEAKDLRVPRGLFRRVRSPRPAPPLQLGSARPTRAAARQPLLYAVCRMGACTQRLQAPTRLPRRGGRLEFHEQATLVATGEPHEARVELWRHRAFLPDTLLGQARPAPPRPARPGPSRLRRAVDGWFPLRDSEGRAAPTAAAAGDAKAARAARDPAASTRHPATGPERRRRRQRRRCRRWRARGADEDVPAPRPAPDDRGPSGRHNARPPSGSILLRVRGFDSERGVFYPDVDPPARPARPAPPLRIPPPAPRLRSPREARAAVPAGRRGAAGGVFAAPCGGAGPRRPPPSRLRRAALPARPPALPLAEAAGAELAVAPALEPLALRLELAAGPARSLASPARDGFTGALLEAPSAALAACGGEARLRLLARPSAQQTPRAIELDALLAEARPARRPLPPALNGAAPRAGAGSTWRAVLEAVGAPRGPALDAALAPSAGGAPEPLAGPSDLAASRAQSALAPLLGAAEPAPPGIAVPPPPPPVPASPSLKPALHRPAARSVSVQRVQWGPGTAGGAPGSPKVIPAP
eukprot:tig00000586_g2255.t1